MTLDKELQERIVNKYGDADVVINLFTMELIWVSTTFADKLGFKAEELVDKHINDVVVLDRSVLMKEVAKMLGKPGIEDTKILRKKNGEKIKVTGQLHSLTHKLQPYLTIKIAKYLNPKKTDN